MARKYDQCDDDVCEIWDVVHTMQMDDRRAILVSEIIQFVEAGTKRSLSICRFLVSEGRMREFNNGFSVMLKVGRSMGGRKQKAGDHEAMKGGEDE
tara:strand:- start:4167 stop:4454 length:288 start_codon:yes stop_codon:yes gene_type:complete